MTAERAASSRRHAATRFLVDYCDSGVSQYAAGLAFNMFVAVFPLLLGLLALISLFAQQTAFYFRSREVLFNAFPVEAHREVLKTIDNFSAHAGELGVLWVAGLVWSGTNLSAAFEFALNRIYGLPVLVAWAYLLSQLVLIGAVFNRARWSVRGEIPQLDDAPVVAVAEDAEPGGVQR